MFCHTPCINYVQYTTVSQIATIVGDATYCDWIRSIPWCHGKAVVLRQQPYHIESLKAALLASTSKIYERMQRERKKHESPESDRSSSFCFEALTALLLLQYRYFILDQDEISALIFGIIPLQIRPSSHQRNGVDFLTNEVLISFHPVPSLLRLYSMAPIQVMKMWQVL